jgi:RNA polymerase sigma-70 factor (ECF subfamily)
MAGRATHPVLRFIRRITVSAGSGDTPDAELLQRFAVSRDAAAFAALVQRHGPMVLGVCQRVLGDVADAEDAFQATFLVLVRRAGAVGRPDLLGQWLYGVAYRTALKARCTAALRRRHEEQAAAQSAARKAAERVEPDLWPLLDEELSRLPEKYRAPVVLCHLQGHTHEEAARRLGCPRETLTTRLTRARERLRQQLVRRGVALSAGTVAGLLSADHLAAAVPPALRDATVFAVETGVIPVPVAVLTKGVMRAMRLSRLKIVAAVLLGVGAIAWSVGLLAHRTLAAEPPQEPIPAVASAVPDVPEAPKGGRAEEDEEPEVSVRSMPPVVVKTVPQAGDTDVDAKTIKEILVIFSKEMADRSWSWTQISKGTFPQTTGKPYYEKDKRTCVLPVKLEPGKTYVIWLNPEKFKGFRDAEGHAAVFYPLVFQTKP